MTPLYYNIHDFPLGPRSRYCIYILFRVLTLNFEACQYARPGLALLELSLRRCSGPCLPYFEAWQMHSLSSICMLGHFQRRLCIVTVFSCLPLASIHTHLVSEAKYRSYWTGECLWGASNEHAFWGRRANIPVTAGLERGPKLGPGARPQYKQPNCPLYVLDIVGYCEPHDD